ncbi:MAG: hydrogenase nickel incorporation protein HypA [Candidatus Hadarchaeia archaeon]
MHEWSLAEGVIETALRVREENDASKIIAINIKIGSLQQVDRKVFDFALEEIARNTKAENSKINIETEGAVLKCRACGNSWDFEKNKEELSEEETESIHFLPDLAHTYIRCPQCESPDFEIEKGRGVWIDSVELEE